MREPTTISTRDALLEAAGDLFYRQGFQATGVKQIIESVGIAKGTFYTHFPSKDALGLAWLEQRHDEWNIWLSEHMEQYDAPKPRLLAMFDFLAEWMPSCDFRGCAFLNTAAELIDPEHPMRQLARQHKQELLDRIEAQIREMRGTGKSKSGNCSQSAKILYLLFDGAIVSARNFHAGWPIEAARKQAASILDSLS